MSTHKERMLRCLQGLSNDSMPWVPRLDLWYRANKRAGTLPQKYRHATLMELTDDMEVGYHAVVPDFQDLRSPDDAIDRTLGIFNLKSMPYKTILEDVERTVRYEGDRTCIEYKTPVGSITTTELYNDEMRNAGITSTHIEERAVKGINDYKVIGYIFSHARIEPKFDGYAEFADYIGRRGIAVAYVNGAASPVHLLQKTLVPFEEFFYHLHDAPDVIHETAEQMEVYWNRMLECAIDVPAEVFHLGANYDAMITYPPFYEQYIQSWLSSFADRLHLQGKYLLTHTDGENEGLLDHYLMSKIDIADSICPAPMTSLSLRDTRDVFGQQVTIMGGIPSVALLPATMPEKNFNTYLEKLFVQCGQGDHIILGIADTTPPAADFQRIERIAEMVQAFGPIPATTKSDS